MNTTAPPAAEFFDRIRSYGAQRPDEGRWAAGVCAGLARRWDLDPLLVRGLFVALGLVTGAGVLVYGLLWLFLPHPDGRIHAQEVLRGTVTPGFVGGLVCVLSNLATTWHDTSARPFNGLFPVVVIVALVWWFSRRHGRPGHGGPRWPGPGPTGEAEPSAPSAADAPAPPAPDGLLAEPAARPGVASTAASAPFAPSAPSAPSAPAAPSARSGATPGGQQPWTPQAVAPRTDSTRPSHALTVTTLGLGALGGAAVVAWDRWVADVPHSAGAVALAVALGIVALGILLTGLSGRRAGGLAPIAVLLAAVTAATTAAALTPGQNAAAVRWTPATATEAAVPHQLGSGRAVLDLTSPTLRAGATSGRPVDVQATVGAGELEVVLPAGVPARVTATAGFGQIDDATGTRTISGEGGSDRTRTIVAGTGDPLLRVTLHVGLGHVQVRTSADAARTTPGTGTPPTPGTVSPAGTVPPAGTGPAASTAVPSTPAVPAPATPTASAA